MNTMTDGACGLAWDDGVITSMTPAPAARCPFEFFHRYDEEGECGQLQKSDIPDDWPVSPVDAEPARIPPPKRENPWYDDRDEVVDFARWFWEGAWSIRGTVGEILDYFEKPWKWEPEHKDYLESKKEEARIREDELIRRVNAR